MILGSFGESSVCTVVKAEAMLYNDFNISPFTVKFFIFSLAETVCWAPVFME